MANKGCFATRFLETDRSIVTRITACGLWRRARTNSNACCSRCTFSNEYAVTDCDTDIHKHSTSL
jgi:hypothetical protein